jgi:UDP-N-acetyl-D-mannosaminuronate dehydrogenase
MPEHVVGRLESQIGDLHDVRVAVLGATYRGAVKETAFSGVWDVVAALTSRGATALVHDPMYSDDEIVAMGFVPFHRGDDARAVVVQADHEEYRRWGSPDAVGAVVVMDGRRIVDASRWPDTDVITIGR